MGWSDMALRVQSGRQFNGLHCGSVSKLIQALSKKKLIQAAHRELIICICPVQITLNCFLNATRKNQSHKKQCFNFHLPQIQMSILLFSKIASHIVIPM
jgi:hypothetical protein